MGSPSSDSLGPARPTPGYAAHDRNYVPPALEPDVRRQPIVLHLVLLAATLASTIWMGTVQYREFLAGASGALPALQGWTPYVHGLWYSVAVLAILGAHEMGHYFACRYYRVDASLPYFLPLPLPPTWFPAGTLGAFIRIRQPFQNKRELFDIGIAGPIAGFLAAIPVLIIGVSLSPLARLPEQGTMAYLAEPLILKGIFRLIWGAPPPGWDFTMHPVLFAGWFGLLATLVNLFPFGQLDGGHISYAVLGRRSTPLSYAALAVAAVLSFFSLIWFLSFVGMLLMLRFLGSQHPPMHDEETPLDAGRLWLAAFAVVMFVLCFMPIPAATVDLATGAKSWY